MGRSDKHICELVENSSLKRVQKFGYSEHLKKEFSGL